MYRQIIEDYEEPEAVLANNDNYIAHDLHGNPQLKVYLSPAQLKEVTEATYQPELDFIDLFMENTTESLTALINAIVLCGGMDNYRFLIIFIVNTFRIVMLYVVKSFHDYNKQ